MFATSLLGNNSRSLEPTYQRQVPPLLRVIASGTSLAFTPSPEGIRASCRALYRARRSLLLQFDGDDWDDSEMLEHLIFEAKEVSLRCHSSYHSLDDSHKLLVPALQGDASAATKHHRL